MSIELHGESNLQHFMDNWEACLCGMRYDQRPQDLEAILLRQLRKCKALEHDIAYYQRLPADHADKSYRFLSSSAHRHLDQVRSEQNLSSIVRAIGETAWLHPGHV